MRIAIVDDIASERTLLRDRLEQQLGRRGVHADLTEFENGETFLKAAKERPFTVLFLDIYMDGANGIEIARELRGFDPDCLLIFTTTSTDKKNIFCIYCCERNHCIFTVCPNRHFHFTTFKKL